MWRASSWPLLFSSFFNNFSKFWTVLNIFFSVICFFSKVYNLLKLSWRFYKSANSFFTNFLRSRVKGKKTIYLGCEILVKTSKISWYVVFIDFSVLYKTFLRNLAWFLDSKKFWFIYNLTVILITFNFHEISLILIFRASKVWIGNLTYSQFIFRIDPYMVKISNQNMKWFESYRAFCSASTQKKRGVRLKLYTL